MNYCFESIKRYHFDTHFYLDFSVDQHGSRFIQQKLDHCFDEEKASVFIEVLPQASKLMTDVFGNYVIQKVRHFFWGWVFGYAFGFGLVFGVRDLSYILVSINFGLDHCGFCTCLNIFL